MEDAGDEDEESLEAELAALQGRPVNKKKAQKKGGQFISVCLSFFLSFFLSCFQIRSRYELSSIC